MDWGRMRKNFEEARDVPCTSTSAGGGYGNYEPGSRAGGHEKRRICSDIGWQAGEVGGQRTFLCRLGDLSHEGVDRCPEPHLRVADEWVVWPIAAGFKRWRQDLVSAGGEA